MPSIRVAAVQLPLEGFHLINILNFAFLNFIHIDFGCYSDIGVIASVSQVLLGTFVFFVFQVREHVIVLILFFFDVVLNFFLALNEHLLLLVSFLFRVAGCKSDTEYGRRIIFIVSAHMSLCYFFGSTSSFYLVIVMVASAML